MLRGAWSLKVRFDVLRAVGLALTSLDMLFDRRFQPSRSWIHCVNDSNSGRVRCLTVSLSRSAALDALHAVGLGISRSSPNAKYKTTDSQRTPSGKRCTQTSTVSTEESINVSDHNDLDSQSTS